MKIGEFTDKYCADILEEKRRYKNLLLEDDGIPYDIIDYDEDGIPFKAMVCEYQNIPVDHIIELEREEFTKIYSRPDEIQCYDNLLDTLIITQGEDVINILRNKMLKEKKSIEEFHAKGGLSSDSID